MSEEKKRGRPPKIQEKMLETPQKRRGRPRKEVVENTIETKKKRGRPRKTPAPEAQITTVDTPKKRGRPRKYPLPEATIVTTNEPKKRGRPRKQQTLLTPTESQKIILVDKDKKVLFLTSSEYNEIKNTSGTDASILTQPKKKRGRPKKEQLAIPETAGYQDTYEELEELGEESYGKPKTFYDIYLKSLRQKRVNKKAKVPEEDLPIKNILYYSNGFVFNFGVRKPIMNLEDVLDYSIWRTHLLDKWVCFFDEYESAYVFIKHIIRDSRILQVAYSGKDVLGDGVWVVYQASITQNPETNLYRITPKEYSIKFGSFECEDYLGELLAKKYITMEEYNTFAIPSRRKAFGSALFKISAD